jgi:hypothetical protein
VVTEKVQAASGQVGQAVLGMGNTIAGSLGTLQSTLGQHAYDHEYAGHLPAAAA